MRGFFYKYKFTDYNLFQRSFLYRAHTYFHIKYLFVNITKIQPRPKQISKKIIQCPVLVAICVPAREAPEAAETAIMAMQDDFRGECTSSLFATMAFCQLIWSYQGALAGLYPPCRALPGNGDVKGTGGVLVICITSERGGEVGGLVVYTGVIAPEKGWCGRDSDGTKLIFTSDSRANQAEDVLIWTMSIFTSES